MNIILEIYSISNSVGGITTPAFIIDDESVSRETAPYDIRNMCYFGLFRIHCLCLFKIYDPSAIVIEIQNIARIVCKYRRIIMKLTFYFKISYAGLTISYVNLT